MQEFVFNKHDFYMCEVCLLITSPCVSLCVPLNSLIASVVYKKSCDL